MTQEEPINSWLVVLVYLSDAVIKIHLGGKNLEAGASFFSPSSCSFSSSYRRFGRPPVPSSSPTGTCRTGTGISAYRPGLLLPPEAKIMIGLKWFTSNQIETGITMPWVLYVCPFDITWMINTKPEKKLGTKKVPKKNPKEHFRTQWQFWYFFQYTVNSQK